MRFDRESWRKLYVAESIEHRAMPLFTRGLRDYLLRGCQDDGTLLRSTRAPSADLARVLAPKDATERKQLDEAIRELLAIGYLTHSGGRLWVTKFEEAQAARSPGAKRQAAYKARQQQASPASSPTTSPAPVTSDVTADALGDVTREETRRDETTTAAAVVDLPIPCPGDLALTEPQRATLLGAMIPEDAIAWLTREFVGKSQGDLADKRTVAVWRKCLSTAISRSWNDPRTKAQFLQAKKASVDDDTGGYGKRDEWAT